MPRTCCPIPGCIVAVVPPVFPVGVAWNWRVAWDWRTTSLVVCEGFAVAVPPARVLNWRTSL
eukprot:11201050-Lingulodinium_polyedra.AAC.1